jgi:hypothetical protein
MNTVQPLHHTLDTHQATRYRFPIHIRIQLAPTTPPFPNPSIPSQPSAPGPRRDPHATVTDPRPPFQIQPCIAQTSPFRPRPSLSRQFSQIRDLRLSPGRTPRLRIGETEDGSVVCYSLSWVMRLMLRLSLSWFAEWEELTIVLTSHADQNVLRTVIEGHRLRLHCNDPSDSMKEMVWV